MSDFSADWELQNFERHVRTCRSTPFKDLPSGLTRNRILSCTAIRSIWLFWMDQPDVKCGSVKEWQQWHDQKTIQAVGYLNGLICVISIIARVSPDEAQVLANERRGLREKIARSTIGESADAIQHLRKAAQLLNLPEDHFFRSTGPSSIVTIEGEDDQAYDYRKLAVECESIRRSYEFEPPKKGSVTDQGIALRIIWPRLHVCSADVEAVFGKSPWVAIRSILKLAQPHFGDMDTSSIRKTILGIDPR